MNEEVLGMNEKIDVDEVLAVVEMDAQDVGFREGDGKGRRRAGGRGRRRRGSSLSSSVIHGSNHVSEDEMGHGAVVPVMNVVEPDGEFEAMIDFFSLASRRDSG